MDQDTETVADMVRVLEVLEAREMLSAITVSSFTSMKKEERSKIMRALNKQSNVAEPQKITNKKLAEILGGIGGR